MTFKAVIFDLGGVVFPSPFEAFDAYDTQRGLSPGFTRGVIRTSSETGAWAAFERSELSQPEFFAALGAEAEAAGGTIDAAELLAGFAGNGGARPEMLAAIRAVRRTGLRTAALTNNWRSDPGDGIGTALQREELFDVVVESSVEGIRKPGRAIYELVLARLGTTAPECVFLDDLGVNLKPARAMGMATIKVTDPETALAELGRLLQLDLAAAGPWT